MLIPHSACPLCVDMYFNSLGLKKIVAFLDLFIYLVCVRVYGCVCVCVRAYACVFVDMQMLWCMCGSQKLSEDLTLSFYFLSPGD